MSFENMRRTIQRTADDVAIGLENLVQTMHGPFDMAGDGTGPAVCTQCEVEWPCKVSMDSFYRREALKAKWEADD